MLVLIFLTYKNTNKKLKHFITLVFSISKSSVLKKLLSRVLQKTSYIKIGIHIKDFFYNVTLLDKHKNLGNTYSIKVFNKMPKVYK